MYGEITYSQEQAMWFIKTQPHVALRLKRVFPKIRKYAQGVIWLSDTLENGRDLKWFIERYPHTVSHPDVLDDRAHAHHERETLVSQLLSGSTGRFAFPMALPPREYQAQAAALLTASGGLLCADDVGLGKTVVAIAAFSDPRLRPALVVTLAHLPKQWQKFINRFAPHLSTSILKKGTPYDIRQKGSIPDVIITNYHKLRGWAATLSGIVKSVTWDEVQELRHPGTDKYDAASTIADACAWRLGLSATPIYNYGAEMYSVMRCVSPGALGSRDEFLTEWCQGSDSVKDPRSFGNYLRNEGWMLRRTRADVGRELPACSSIPCPVESDSSYIDKATKDCESLARVILASTQDYKGQKMQASAEFDMRMRQATGIAKATYVADFVRMLVEGGEKVVLYGWHREVYGIWQRKLEDLQPVLYTGSESSSQKEHSKEQFVSGQSKVMLISLRAGAGLDGLQDVCSTVVFGELDWSPGVHEQCIGRIYRDGQAKPVFAYYLLSDEGSDPIIADVIGVKTRQIEGIRDPNAELLEELSIDPDHIKKLASAYLKRRSKYVSPALAPLSVQASDPFCPDGRITPGSRAAMEPTEDSQNG